MTDWIELIILGLMKTLSMQWTKMPQDSDRRQHILYVHSCLYVYVE